MTDHAALPEFTTPDALAEHLGCSARRVRDMARRLGACRVVGNRMVLMQEDVVIILKAAKPNFTIDDVKDWIAADAAEIIAEKDAQGWITPNGNVYFVRRAGEVKIGFTTDIDQRLQKFRSASADDFSVLLMIPGTPALEQYFHRKFCQQRIVREWFHLAGPIEEFIARRMRTMGMPS